MSAVEDVRRDSCWFPRVKHLLGARPHLTCFTKSLTCWVTQRQTLVPVHVRKRNGEGSRSLSQGHAVRKLGLEGRSSEFQSAFPCQ